MGNISAKPRSRTEWSPARVVWLAQIAVQEPGGAGTGDVRIARTAWCTDSEALFFLQRRLPNTSIPSGCPRGTRLYGILAPATVYTTRTNGKVVQSYAPDLAAARYASVDNNGRLTWSATQPPPSR